MPHFDGELHVQGRSVFVGDLPEPKGTLFAHVLTSPAARGSITGLSTSAAEKAPGVEAVLTWRDIPGENQTGNIVMDEPLLARGEVHYIGQPVAVVIAGSATEARRACELIELAVREEKPVLDPRESCSRGELIVPPRTIGCGNPAEARRNSAFTVSGTAETGAQEHLYLETQSALAVPLEDGGLRIASSTQGPSYVQKIAARVLGVPSHRIQVEVPRLGGAFGGKEDQATPWAVIAALGAFVTGKPVKLVLSRHQDLVCTGKRHPYTSDYTMGLDENGLIVSWEVDYYQDSGAAGDLSTAVMERTLFHTTGSYFVPNVRATGYCCRTNVPPNTAFRGFGGPQAMFVIEAALRKASSVTGIPVHILQERNLLKPGDRFPFGAEYRADEARSSWKLCRDMMGLDNAMKRAEEFNSAGGRMRRGISMMPVCFGISFTTTFLNQASALVHVYTDGSVGISTGAVEMGQGVNSRIRQAAALELGIPVELTRMEATSTTRNANTSPTAASSGADMNGNAAAMACREILIRMLRGAAERTGVPEEALSVEKGRLLKNGEDTGTSWEELAAETYSSRISLSSHAHYATPGIHFDGKAGKGEPFAYHVAGAALTEATVDTLLGTFTIDRVGIVHCGGSQLDPVIDLGQVEGGLIQGIGWVTIEEVGRDPETGRLLADALATYKVPQICSTPEIAVMFAPGETLPGGIGLRGSKAVGEPPFMYGIGAWFAIADAMGTPVEHTAPMTPERVLMSLRAGNRSRG